MKESQEVLVESKGPILLVTINRPFVKNALAAPTSRKLADIFRSFDTDEQHRVAIITGTGEDAFCAGNDVKFMATASKEERRLSAEGFGGLTHFFNRTKPIIAAVNGLAMGGGFEIALASDIIIASDQATFSLPEPKIGLVALGGGIHRLARQIPYKQAVELLITGKRISAVEGKDLGFVNQVVPSHELLPACFKMAEQIMRGSPLAIEITLTALREGINHASLQEAMKGDATYYKRLSTSADVKEGIAAFAEKRKPRWSGK